VQVGAFKTKPSAYHRGNGTGRTGGGSHPESAKDGGRVKPGDRRGVAAAGTLVVLASMALVAYVVTELRPAAPVEIAEVIAATAGLLTAAAAAVRAMWGK
jgi:hypothetical protein